MNLDSIELPAKSATSFLSCQVWTSLKPSSANFLTSSQTPPFCLINSLCTWLKFFFSFVFCFVFNFLPFSVLKFLNWNLFPFVSYTKFHFELFFFFLVYVGIMSSSARLVKDEQVYERPINLRTLPFPFLHEDEIKEIWWRLKILLFYLFMYLYLPVLMN